MVAAAVIHAGHLTEVSAHVDERSALVAPQDRATPNERGPNERGDEPHAKEDEDPYAGRRSPIQCRADRLSLRDRLGEDGQDDQDPQVKGCQQDVPYQARCQAELLPADPEHGPAAHAARYLSLGQGGTSAGQATTPVVAYPCPACGEPREVIQDILDYRSEYYVDGTGNQATALVPYATCHECEESAWIVAGQDVVREDWAVRELEAERMRYVSW